MARVKDLWFTGDRRRTAKYGRGKRWLAVWTGPGGTEHAKAFDRKIDAERHGAAMEADQLRGVYVDPRRGAQLVRDYAEREVPAIAGAPAAQLCRAPTHRTCASTSIHCSASRRIGSLQKSDIKSFVAAKAAELAPSTVETVVAVLRAMLASAVEDGVIPINPAARVPAA